MDRAIYCHYFHLLKSLCKLLNEHLRKSSESVTELVVRLCDTFYRVSNSEDQ